MLRSFGRGLKPRPNDRNISMQHIPTLLALHLQAPAKRSQHFNATDRNIVGRNMCVFGHPVAMCCELKIELVRMPRCNIVAQTWPNDYNIMQHPQMLHEYLTIFKFEPSRVATSQHIAPNNVVICCVEMLRSFGRGFMLKIFTIMLIHNAQKILLCFKDAPIMLQYADIKKLW